MKHGGWEQRELMIGGPPSCGGSAPMFFWSRFQERLRHVAEMIADAYAAGVVDRLPADLVDAIRAAKLQMDQAIRNGNFNLAEQAIQEWERVWTDALNGRNRSKGTI